MFHLTELEDQFPSQESSNSLQQLSSSYSQQTQRQTKDIKGKGKACLPPVRQDDNRLWVDKYEPSIEVPSLFRSVSS